MGSTDCAVVVMPGPRVMVRGVVPRLEPEDDPGIHGSNRATALRCFVDCRGKPGNDSTRWKAGPWLTGPEHKP
jgi:hypothetical protein